MEESLIPQVIPIKNLDQVFSSCGGFGRMQIIASVLLLTSIVSGEMIINNLAYLTLLPQTIPENGIDDFCKDGTPF